jgi:hypothetical protein
VEVSCSSQLYPIRNQRRLAGHQLARALLAVKSDLILEPVELEPEGFVLSWSGGQLASWEQKKVERHWLELLGSSTEVREMVPISAEGLLQSQGQPRLAEAAAGWGSNLVQVVEGLPWAGGEVPQEMGGVGHLIWDELEVRGDWFPNEAEKERLVRARRGRADGEERAPQLQLWDDKGRWLPRGVALVRAFISWWEGHQRLQWVVAPGRNRLQHHLEMLEQMAGPVAQWGDLYGNGLLCVTWVCAPAELGRQLAARLQCMSQLFRMLGLECSALVQASTYRRAIQSALQRAGLCCEFEDQGREQSVVLLLRDRFGTDVQGPQLRIGSQVNHLSVEEAWEGRFRDFVTHLLQLGPLPMAFTPEQVRMMPISDGDCVTARQWESELRAVGVRVASSSPKLPLGQRIAEASQLEIPYLLVVGEREREAGMVSVRHAGQQRQIPWSEAKEEIVVAHQ